MHALPESFTLQSNIGAGSTCKLQVDAVYIYIYITIRTKNMRGSGEQQRNLSRSVPDWKMNGCQCAAVPKEHLLKKDCSE